MLREPVHAGSARVTDFTFYSPEVDGGAACGSGSRATPGPSKKYLQFHLRAHGWRYIYTSEPH